MKRIAAAFTLAFTLVACSSATHHTATPKVTATPVSTPTTVDPTLIPPVITIDYLNAVLARLDNVRGDAFRLMVATGQFPVGVTDRLRAIYNDPLYARELRVFSEEFAAGFGNVRRPPGDRRTVVVRILGASMSCVWAETHTDLSAVVLADQNVAASEYIALVAKQRGGDATLFNPTPWAVADNPSFPNPTPPPADPCAAS